jgi:cell division protein FtsL
MSVARMFDRRFRGFRVVNVFAAIVLVVLMVGVYLAKTRAARDSAAIAKIERQMVAERNAIRMLKAEAARLENPERIEKLAVEYLAMAPSKAEREAAPAELAAVAAGQPVGVVAAQKAAAAAAAAAATQARVQAAPTAPAAAAPQ